LFIKKIVLKITHFSEIGINQKPFPTLALRAFLALVVVNRLRPAVNAYAREQYS